MSLVNPLNPAAGDVPLPEDQREIDAALRAGRISYRIFPYFDWRYGERGRKFTHSDSAWLAWLTRHDLERVLQQIVWLRSVLSNRGMPSWILATHLTVLYRQLARTVPENEPRYRSLSTCADRLRQDYEQQIAGGRRQQLVDDFVGALGRKSSRLLTGAARLLVAAVADEKLGVKNSVRSLEPWLLDVSRLRKLTGLQQRLHAADRVHLNSESFEKCWRDAVAATIAAARREKVRAASN